jgi:hypothetical protein
MEAVWQNYCMDESIHTSGTTQPERRNITRQLTRTALSLAPLVASLQPHNQRDVILLDNWRGPS